MGGTTSPLGFRTVQALFLPLLLKLGLPPPRSLGTGEVSETDAPRVLSFCFLSLPSAAERLRKKEFRVKASVLKKSGGTPWCGPKLGQREEN